jgi:hypothetical protein
MVFSQPVHVIPSTASVIVLFATAVAAGVALSVEVDFPEQPAINAVTRNTKNRFFIGLNFESKITDFIIAKSCK